MAKVTKRKNVPKRRGELGLTYNINCGKCGCYSQRLLGINTIGELLADVSKEWEYDHKLGWICSACVHTAAEEAKKRKLVVLAKLANMDRFSGSPPRNPF